MKENELYQTGLRLWKEWTEMWNGRPELARALVGDTFALHLTLPASVPEESVHDPESVERWVRAHRARFDRLEFRFECGPFVDVVAGVVAGPWIADVIEGSKPRPTCGMDTIAFRDGKIVEYWTIAKPVDAFGRWGSRVSR